MGLTRAEVDKVALLARLRFSPTEVDLFTDQLGKIVDFVRQLDALDTTAIEPLAHSVELQNVLADDVERPSLDRAAALANAPKQDGECFRVPAVLGE